MVTTKHHNKDLRC